MNVEKYLQGKADGTLKSATETRNPSNVERYLAKKKGAAVQNGMPPARSRRERAPWQSETEQSE